jgi:hypothetical protein
MTFQYTLIPELGNIANALGRSWTNIQFFGDVQPSDITQPDPVDLLAGGQGINLLANNSAIGEMTLNNPASIAVSATGTVASFRSYDGFMNCTAQGSVTLPGDGGDMIMNELTVTAGQTILVTAFTLQVTTL